MLTNQRPLNQIPTEQTYVRHQYGIFGLNRRLDERGETAVFAMLHTPENCLSKTLLQNSLA